MMAWSYHFKHLFFQIQELVDANHTSKTELGVGTSASTHNNGSVNNPTVEITPGTPPTIHVNEKPLPEIKPEPIKEEEKKPVDGGGLSVPGIVWYCLYIIFLWDHFNIPGNILFIFFIKL